MEVYFPNKQIYIDRELVNSDYYLNFNPDDFDNEHLFAIESTIPYDEYNQTIEWDIDPTVTEYNLSFISTTLYEKEGESSTTRFYFIDQDLNSIPNPYYDRTAGIDIITPTIDPVEIIPDGKTNLLWLWILLPILLLIILIGIAILIFYKKKN